ncbi:MAG: TrmH family RNA methyltransferase [Spirochaetaceae bacterium]
MISVRKLATLPRKTRLRKTVQLLETLERACLAGRAVDLRYVREMAALLRDDGRVGERTRARAAEAAELREADAACRTIDALRNALRAELGRMPADWDLLTAGEERLDASVRRVRDFFVYLEDLRSPFNVGSIIRTAESFGVRKVFVSPDTPRPDHPRAARTAMGSAEVVPWSVCSLEEARSDAAACAGAADETSAPGAADVGSSADPAGAGSAAGQASQPGGTPREAESMPVFALETGGMPLSGSRLPEPGLVVVGSEELGVSPAALALSDNSFGRVSIPMAGAKASLNVSVAFGILAFAWWSADRNRRETGPL